MPDKFEDIEMDKNSAMGFILCVTGGLMAFCLTWRIWWLLVIAGLFALAAIIGRGFVRDTKKIIPASEIEEHYLTVATRRGPRPSDHAGRGIPGPPMRGSPPIPMPRRRR